MVKVYKITTTNNLGNESVTFLMPHQLEKKGTGSLEWWSRGNKIEALVLQSEVALAEAKLKKAVDGLNQISYMICMHSEGGSEDLGQAKSKALETLKELSEVAGG